MGRSVRPVSPAARDGPARHGLGVNPSMYINPGFRPPTTPNPARRGPLVLAFDGCFSMSVERSVEVDVMALAEASTLRRDSASELSFMTAI